MLPLPAVFSPELLIARALNALLQREPWAAERLGRHAGKSLRFTIGPLRAGFSIQASGQLRACDPAVVPDVSLTLGAEHLNELPGILRSRDLAAITEKLHVQGDAALATLVSELARDLRWDIEEDLANVFGDIMGPALLRGGRAAVDLAQSAAQRAAGNVAEYLGEESRLMATRPALETFAAECAAMLQRLNALEQRVGDLHGAQAGLHTPGAAARSAASARAPQTRRGGA